MSQGEVLYRDGECTSETEGDREEAVEVELRRCSEVMRGPTAECLEEYLGKSLGTNLSRFLGSP